MSDILVYRCLGVAGGEPGKSEDTTRVWRPGPFSWVPSEKGGRYAAYAVFHWLRVFKSRDYCCMSLGRGQAMSSMLCVPTYFRWPFMASTDIQFTYVMTSAAARGQGLASRLLAEGMRRLARPDRFFWYVTSEDNRASQALAFRAGFVLCGRATRHGRVLKQLRLEQPERCP